MAYNTMFFDYLKNILCTQDINILANDITHPLFNTTYSVFMVDKYLSMHTNKTISDKIVKLQSTLEKLSPEAHYRLMLKIIPKQYSSFIRYIK